MPGVRTRSQLLKDVAKEESVRAVLASKADVMRYYDPVRIQGYCGACEKYGLFWSCPPFDEAPLKKLPTWSHAVLITQKTWVDPGSTKESLVDQFLAARQILGDTLERWAAGVAIAVIAGHCSGCSACTRSKGYACCSPGRMRYSLEGLGFDVTGIAEGLVGQKMDWPTSGVPAYLLIVGALLCPSHDIAERIVVCHR